MNTENKNTTKSTGKVLKWVLILGGVLVLVIVITTIIGNISIFKKAPETPPEELVAKSEGVTEVVVKDIRYKLVEAKDLGNILRGPGWQRPSEGTHIEVTIEAENLGEKKAKFWDFFYIIDGQGRESEFSLSPSDIIPEESECGGELEPNSPPKKCTKIFEMAADSTDLRLKISSDYANEHLIDLGL